MIFAYNRCGILTSHKVESGKSINGKYYEEYIKKTQKQASRRKSPKYWQLVQYFYVTTNSAHGVTSWLERYVWKTLFQHPYSPDISPCD